MSKLQELKDEYIRRIEEHSSLDQPALRERVGKVRTLKALAEMCRKDANHWFREGEYWDHWFYTQWGAIADSIAKQAGTALTDLQPSDSKPAKGKLRRKKESV